MSPDHWVNAWLIWPERYLNVPSTVIRGQCCCCDLNTCVSEQVPLFVSSEVLFNSFREEGAPPRISSSRLPSIHLWPPSSSSSTGSSSCPPSSYGPGPAPQRHLRRLWGPCGGNSLQVFSLSRLRPVLCLPGSRDTHWARSAAHLAPATGEGHHEKTPACEYMNVYCIYTCIMHIYMYRIYIWYVYVCVNVIKYTGV